MLFTVLPIREVVFGGKNLTHDYKTLALASVNKLVVEKCIELKMKNQHQTKTYNAVTQQKLRRKTFTTVSIEKLMTERTNRKNV